MQRPWIDPPTDNHIVAVFAANALSFKLPRAATLEDLAERLTYLTARHGGALLSVDVRLSA